MLPSVTLAVAWELTLRSVFRSLLPARIADAEDAARRLAEIAEQLRIRARSVVAAPSLERSRSRSKAALHPEGQALLDHLHETAALKDRLLPVRELPDPLTALGDVGFYEWTDQVVTDLMDVKLKASLNSSARSCLRILRQVESIACDLSEAKSTAGVSRYAHGICDLFDVHSDAAYDAVLDDILDRLDQPPLTERWTERLCALGTWKGMHRVTKEFPELNVRFGPHFERMLATKPATEPMAPRTEATAESAVAPDVASVTDAEPVASETGKRSTKRGEKLPVKMRALQVLLAHPEWTNREIAQAIGTDPNYLSQLPAFREARRRMKAGSLPLGSKARDGTIEAWED